MLEEGHGVQTVVVEELWLARRGTFRHAALRQEITECIHVSS